MIPRLVILFLAASCASAQDGLLDVYDGETLWKGGLQVSGGWFFTGKSRFLEGDDARHDALHRTYREHRLTLSASYGLLPELSLCAALPWVRKELIGESASGRFRDSGDGLGDAAVVAKYRVWKQDLTLFSINWTVFGGVEAPTGETNSREYGERLSHDLQPGSGSWDFIAATAATLDIDRLKINAVVRGIRNGLGAQDFKAGDLLVGELTVGYRVRMNACVSSLHWIVYQ